MEISDADGLELPKPSDEIIEAFEEATEEKPFIRAKVGPSKKRIRKALIDSGLHRSFFTKRRTRSRFKNYREARKVLHYDDRVVADRLYNVRPR